LDIQKWQIDKIEFYKFGSLRKGVLFLIVNIVGIEFIFEKNVAIFFTKRIFFISVKEHLLSLGA
jgi:hypothetical protein